MTVPKELVEAIEATQAALGNVAAGECRTLAQKLRKMAAKKDVPADMAEEEIVQDGPTLRFIGRMIADYSTERPGSDRWQVGEVWETRGGAYIAVLAGVSEIRGERELVKAIVVPPADDEAARQRAVMDHFGWNPFAREMARKRLKWETGVWVD